MGLKYEKSFWKFPGSMSSISVHLHYCGCFIFLLQVYDLFMFAELNRFMKESFWGISFERLRGSERGCRVHWTNRVAVYAMILRWRIYCSPL